MDVIRTAAPAANLGGAFTAVAGTPRQFQGGASTDPRGKPLTYAWNLGDGSIATGVSPVHTYAIVGPVTVSLTVTDTSGLSSTATASGTVEPGTPVANAGGPYAGTATVSVSFSASGTTDPQAETLTYAWNFGDGSVLATGVNANHTYRMPGTYTVSVTATNTSNLSAMATTRATIAAAVPLANAGGPYAGTAGTALTLSGSRSTDPQGEVLSYTWNFGDGTGGTEASPSHTYARAGSYAISLIVTNTSGLSATATAPATIAVAPPTENRVMAGQQPISNSSVQLYAVDAGGTVGSVRLLTAPVVSDQNGGFSIAGLYICPSPDSQVYLTATGGNPGLAAGTNNAAISLMAALGSCASLRTSSAYITVDEVSTVVAVWPASLHMSSRLGFDTADPRIVSNAFVDSANLASIVSGTPAYPGTAIANQDLAVRSLASSLNACVSSNGDTSAGSPCSLLFAAATPPGGTARKDTAFAAWNIAINPVFNVSTVYSLAVTNPPFGPVLTTPPIDWTLGLPHPTPVTFGAALNHSTVFMGDSITNFWPMPINNVGIGGQHASEMLARFPADVLGHGYGRVVILAGTNDIWLPIAGSDQTVEQIESMAAIARAAGIEPILCELPPITSNPSYFDPLIISFNAALAEFAMSNGYLLVDYYTPMVGHPEYFTDGVHPNATGYAVMEAALSSVVEQ
jgi:PKD repeat protein